MTDVLHKLSKAKLFYYLIVNRVFIFIATYFFAISSPDQKVVPFTSFWNFFLTFGKRWDGNSYTFIAGHGYVTQGPERFFIVFPPLYPTLVKILSFITGDYVVAGVILANIFFIAGMLFLYKLLRLDYNEKFSAFVVVLISVFPTTFFFSVAYPESLFVLLFVASFYYARKRNYLLAGSLGGLAVITRPFGIMIFPALVMQLWQNGDLKLKNIFNIGFPFALTSAFYLAINFLIYGDALAFEKFLSQNWYKSYSYPWDGIISSWKRGFFGTDTEYQFIVGYGEAVASTLAWLSIPFGIRYWGLKSSYLVYLVLGTVFFTSTGFILGAPRYLLSIPPFFIVLAKLTEKSKLIKTVWITTSVILLFMVAYKFAWGHWTY